MISLERLRTVRKFPFTASPNSARRWKIWLSIVTVWFIPLLSEGPKAIYLLEYKREGVASIGSYCTFIWRREPALSAKMFSGVILIVEGLVPLVIFISCFHNIRKCLLREENRLSGRKAGNAFNEGYQYYLCWQIVQRRHTTAKILMIATAAFVVCWIPNKIMFFMISYIGEKHSSLTWNSPVYQIGILLGFTGSCINPFLYALQSREFRKHSKKALSSLLPKSVNDDFGYSQF